MRHNLVLSIIILLLAISLVGGATTAWFSDESLITPNIFIVTDYQEGSAWGDGTVYHAPNHRYFEYTKGQLMESPRQHVALIQGPDSNKTVVGKVTAWIQTVGGVQTLFVEFDTTGYGLIKKTDVYAGLSAAGNPPIAPGQYGSHRTYPAPVLISLHNDITMIKKDTSGATISIAGLKNSDVIRIAAHADVYY